MYQEEGQPVSTKSYEISVKPPQKFNIWGLSIHEKARVRKSHATVPLIVVSILTSMRGLSIHAKTIVRKSHATIPLIVARYAYEYIVLLNVLNVLHRYRIFMYNTCNLVFICFNHIAHVFTVRSNINLRYILANTIGVKLRHTPKGSEQNYLILLPWSFHVVQSLGLFS